MISASRSLGPAISFYLTMLAQYRSRFKWMVGIYAIKHTAWLSYPLAITLIIDKFIPARRFDFILGTIGFVALAGVVNYVLHRRYMVMQTEVTKSVSRNLRNRIVHKLQLLTLQYHADNESGRFFSKMMMDVDKTEQFANMLFGTIMGSIFTVLISAVILAASSWKVLLLYLVCMPGYLLIYRFFQKRFALLQNEARKANEDLGQSISQFIQTSTLSRVHGEEDYEMRRIDSKNRAIIDRYRAINKDIASFGVIISTFSQLFMMTIIAVCALAIIKGNMTVGALVLFLNYINQINGAITMLINQFPVITEFSESVSSIHEVLNAPDEELNQGKRVLETIRGTVRFEGVRFGYMPGKLVLNGVDVTVEQGQTVALIGASGSGKTTFVNLALGLLRGYTGSIRIDDSDIETLDMRSVRKRVGVVTQTPILFRGSIYENVAHGREHYDRAEVEEAVRLANAEEFVLQLPRGYETIIGEMGATLSGGQKQRLAIARAIFRRPALLVLDEATSALDPAGEREVQKGIDSLIGRQTTLVIAHRLSTIFRADVILVFDKGHIVERGSHNELIEQGGVYASMLQMQMGITSTRLPVLKL